MLYVNINAVVLHECNKYTWCTIWEDAGAERPPVLVKRSAASVESVEWRKIPQPVSTDQTSALKKVEKFRVEKSQYMSRCGGGQFFWRGHHRRCLPLVQAQVLSSAMSLHMAPHSNQSGEQATAVAWKWNNDKINLKRKKAAHGLFDVSWEIELWTQQRKTHPLSFANVLGGGTTAINCHCKLYSPFSSRI